MMQVIKDVLANASDNSAAAAFMHLISWVATQFAIIVKHTGRAAITDPAHQQQQLPQQAVASSTNLTPLSADFHFFATLLQPLLSHMQLLDASVPPDVTWPGQHADDVNEDAPENAAGHAASQAALPKQGKGAKGRKQVPLQAKGVPLDWSTAAKGAALLVGLQSDPHVSMRVSRHAAEVSWLCGSALP